jgi:hypothetical protein
MTPTKKLFHLSFTIDVYAKSVSRMKFRRLPSVTVM